MEEETLAMFGKVATTRQAESTAAEAEDSRRAAKQPRNVNWGKGKGPNRRGGKPTNEGSEDILVTLDKMALRAEDETKMLKQDYSLVLFLKPGQNSILHLMHNTATKWKEEMKARPSDRIIPLRTVMLTRLIHEVITRLEALRDQPEMRQTLAKLGWRDEDVDGFSKLGTLSRRSW